MQGKIIKGIAGFYYVHYTQNENNRYNEDSKDNKDHEYKERAGIYECKAKGIFRKEQRKPLVGDDVEFDVLSQEEKTGNIIEILPRRNELVRPAVANIDQALVIFAITRPSPNLNLLDRFLIMMERQGLKSIICFNKQDIASEEEKENLSRAYETCGYQVLFASALEQESIRQLKELLQHKTTTVAGPSGVGKSSLINRLQPGIQMETGAISEKIARGRHTTRHTELISLGEGAYIMDTPGFSSLGLFDMTKEELGNYYPEFRQYEEKCRFQGCAHIHEPDCAVKKALQDGAVSQIRYDNYVLLYEELKRQKRY